MYQQGFVKQKNVILRHCSFKLKFPTFINIAISGKLYQCSSCCSKLEQHGSNVCVSILAQLSSVWFTKKSMFSIAVVFHKSSLILALYTFRGIKIKTLILNGFKNQTNDKFKLLGHNCNHQQGCLK